MSITRLALVFCAALAVYGKLTPEQQGQLPPAANVQVDFARDIKPIFEASCVKCHGKGKDKGAFNLDTREAFLKGGDSGPAAQPGKSAESYLIELVSGLDPDNIMPQKGSKLTTQQVGLLRAWIDQGMKWDPSITFAKTPPTNLLPRKPSLPSGVKSRPGGNEIDIFLGAYFKEQKFNPPPVVPDRVFARRVYLDLIGLLPAPSELEEFLQDKSVDKRQRLVRKLLGDKRRYAEHWLSFWNDALRNDYKGTGYIDDGRKQITEWLLNALANNLPYDQFVAQLINPTPESEGFVKGIVWRGVVNASQAPEMQAAQNISQVFMGVNLKCASCHDSFINDWTLADAYGLASVYAEKAMEMYQCDKPTGKTASIRFIYPELGQIDAEAPKAERMKQLAQLMTSQHNARLSRTIVNRFWARLMGRGLIEPVDEMENKAWHADLLDWLASDLAENGFNLKRTLELIATSQAYQLPSVGMAEIASRDFQFRGPLVKRMSAEQFVDALAAITGLWNELPAPQMDFSAVTGQGDPSMERPIAPRWIWNDSQAKTKAAASTVYFRREVDLPEAPTEALAVITCDNSFKFYVNGKEAGSSKDFQKPKLIEFKKHLKAGKNLFAIAAVNDPGGSKEDPSNPAGLLGYIRLRKTIRTNDIPIERIWDLATDESWLWSSEKAEDWEKPSFQPQNWQTAAVLGEIGMEPWNLASKFERAFSGARLFGEVRASLVNADPLTVALGRPNREQVITSRPSAATTLQALELTNGPTLANQIKRGSEHLIGLLPRDPEDFTRALYQRVLGRVPSSLELRLCVDVLSSGVLVDGVEDMLWAMTMLPEFQLIY